MAEPWEEALDLDDSDFPFKRQSHHKTASASHPSLHRCSQLNPPSALIPGPAGTLQAAMLRRRSNRDDFGEEPIPTQEYIRKVVEDGVAEHDDDFTRDPWLYAVNFIRAQGLAFGDGAIGIPVSAIKSRTNMDKVPQVVAIVKACTPNGLGDMMVTLKDPTGTIDATIHGRVLSEREFGKDISIGAVVILQKVAVFSPSRFTHYLNITLSNMVKVISKDSKLSSTQNYFSPTVKHDALVSEPKENSSVPEKSFSLSQGRTEGIMNNLRQNADTRSSENAELMKREKVSKCSCRDDGNYKNQNAVAGKDVLLAKQNMVNEIIEVADGADEVDNDDMMACEQRNPTQAGRGNILEGAESGSPATASLIDVFRKHESGRVNGTNCRQLPTPKVSPPQWTDEQLDKLFAVD